MNINDQPKPDCQHFLSQCAYDYDRQQKPLAISIKQFCHLTSLGRTSAFKLIFERKLETLAVGGRTLILWRSVEALLGLRSEGDGR